MAVPRVLAVTQGNTQDIKLFGLQDEHTGDFWNAGVASATLYDEMGNKTSIQDIPLIYQSGSNGDYLGTITTDIDDLTLTASSGYVMKIDAQQGASKFHIEIPTNVIVRTQQ